MRFLRAVTGIIVLVAFLLTMRSRLYETYVVSSEPYVCAQSPPQFAHWFILPQAIRREADVVETIEPVIESSFALKPAFTTATIICSVALLLVASHCQVDWLTRGLIHRYPLETSLVMYGVGVITFECARARQRAVTKELV